MRAMTFAVLLVVLLIAACGGDSEDAPSPADPGQPVSTGGGPSDSLPRPPGTAASAGGRSVEMGVGSYCWRTACVDMIGPVTKGTLTVSAGARVRVAVPAAAGDLDEAQVSASPATGQAMKLDSGEEVWGFAAVGASTDLTAKVDAGEVSFTADLAPGLYIVSVFLVFDAGDVSYGLVLRVE